ncbi:MAG: 50S ribosomal protein L11, partial [Candidatus Binatia bacterium]
PVIITVYADRSFSFVTKTPPVPVLIKKSLNIEKGSGEPAKKIIASLTRAQAKEIATTKLPDLNVRDLDAAIRTVEGTARSMGILVVD